MDAAASKIPVAIVGGGITGAMVASLLCSDDIFDVTIYDQGRRGPGGRASHRAVAVDGEGGGQVLQDDPPIAEGAVEFDHGCQFTRADDARMKALVKEWEALGWIGEWAGRFGAIADQSCPDFFGLPSNDTPVFIGVGGMHMLPRHILRTSSATVHRGVRVAGMQREADGMWSLLGVSGEAAFHDTAEAAAACASQEVLGRYAAVILTDVSSSSGGWHRASAGVPDALAARVRDRARVPLFSAMVAFAEPLGLPLDGITFGPAWSDSVGDDAPDETRHRRATERPLWFAARSQSKPGLQTRRGDRNAPDEADVESWTLISTPRFAVEEITETPMQDTKTGAFKPQEDSYLNHGPVPALVRAFMDAVGPLRTSATSASATRDFPKVVYLQGQRWGSALPAPVDVDGRDARGHGKNTTHVFDIAYEGATPPLVYARPSCAAEDEASEGDGRDFIADDALRLYYAGDFVSRRAPGFEAAALSGIDAAEHIRKSFANVVPSPA